VCVVREREECVRECVCVCVCVWRAGRGMRSKFVTQMICRPARCVCVCVCGARARFCVCARAHVCVCVCGGQEVK